MKDIQTICGGKSAAFGTRDTPAWKQIVVCLVIPGIDEYDTGVLDVLQTMGIFQDRIMKKDVNGKAPVNPPLAQI
jgi:chitin synthase